MKMKKLIVGAVVLLLSTVTLSACSSNKGTEIATMKGAKITAEDYYEQTKLTSTSKQAIVGMIIFKVFSEKYEDKVNKDDINKQIEEFKKTEGYETTLANNGLTLDSYKKNLTQNAAFQEGLKANMDIKDDELKTAFETYHPEVEAQIIKVSSEDTANTLLQKINDGGDFTSIAKESSEDTVTKEDGGTVKFSSAKVVSPEKASIPEDVKTAAFELKNDAVSSVITTTGYDANYQQITSYYIVKMVKNADKGSDYKKYKDELTEIVQNNYMSDQTFVLKVIGDELNAANVKIKDNDLKDILASYMPTTSSSSSTEESSSAKSSSKTSASSTEETDESK